MINKIKYCLLDKQKKVRHGEQDFLILFYSYNLLRNACLLNNVSSVSTWLSSEYNNPTGQTAHIAAHHEILYILYIFQEQYNTHQNWCLSIFIYLCSVWVKSLSR
jgi:hypothetical protein